MTPAANPPQNRLTLQGRLEGTNAPGTETWRNRSTGSHSTSEPFPMQSDGELLGNHVAVFRRRSPGRRDPSATSIS